MTQEPHDGDVGLSRGCELRPDIGDRCVERELAAIGEMMSAECQQPLVGGLNVDDGVALPAPLARRIRVTAPEIDHWSAVQVHRHCGAELVALLEVLQEDCAHGVEP